VAAGFIARMLRSPRRKRAVIGLWRPRTAEYHGLVVQMLRRALRPLSRLSPMWWLGRKWPLLRDRDELTKRQVRSRQVTRRRMLAVDAYVAVWLVIETALVVACLLTWINPYVAFAATFAVGLRIVEILRATVNTALLDQLGSRKDNRIGSAPRLVVLGLVNFGELGACYGVLYANNADYLHGARSLADGPYFSAITQFTVGYGEILPREFARALVLTQLVGSFLLAALVLSRLIASLPTLWPVFGQPNGQRDT